MSMYVIIRGACLSSFNVIPIKVLLEQTTQLVVTLLELVGQERLHVWMQCTRLIISLHPHNILLNNAIVLPQLQHQLAAKACLSGN